MCNKLLQTARSWSKILFNDNEITESRTDYMDKTDSREKLIVPKLGWLSGDKFSTHGNTYTGSVDAVSLSFNAFCYKLEVNKEDAENPIIKAQSYDVLTKNQPDEHKYADFPLSDEGRDQVLQWLNERYDDYLDAGRNEVPVKF
jgi:hypothetical protein